MSSVAVVIPSLPTRTELLARALASVAAQTHPVSSVSIAYDINHEGASATRNNALWPVLNDDRCEWVAFLDDDDALLPHHVEHLLGVAETTGASVVWGWFEVTGNGADPFPHYRGKQYNPVQPHVVPITYMARTQALEDASLLLFREREELGPFFPDTIGCWDVADQPLLDALHKVTDGKMYADPTTSWQWQHHGQGRPGKQGNTSGLAARRDDAR